MPAPLPATPHRPPGAPVDGNLPVLILDDERFDRHRLARLCSGLDFTCAISNARTLTEFADLLERGSYALILVDYALPDGTGLDALDMVRLSARNLNAATLLISGQAEASVTDAARRIGCAGHISKDALSPDRFAQAVRAALATGPAPAPAIKPGYAAEEVEALIGACAARCARDIKPMISRMLRQMRDLRHAGTAPGDATLEVIEQNCMSLWAFLIEMEREDGAALLAEIAQAADPAPPRAARSRPARPPSVFGRRHH